MKKVLLLLSFLFLLVFLPTPASANHSWGGYHWARTANPFTLKLGDNLSSNWKPFLGVASSDWSQSNVLDTVIVPGQAKRNCQPTAGRDEVCNKTYGNNGWLGIAQIWINGLHITQGVTKMNDTYFNTPTYNTSAWRQMVVCQEVAHTFGLDHQDEIFNNPNLGTCMDYTNDPTTNQHPNAHDYEELDIIYAHLDTFTTVDQTSSQVARQLAFENADNPGQWGRQVKGQGKVAVYERDFGGGQKLVTFVIWAE